MPSKKSERKATRKAKIIKAVTGTHAPKNIHPKLKKARGLINQTRGWEGAHDAASDNDRVGRKNYGLKSSTKKMKTGPNNTAAGRASGKAMGEAAKKRRGGLSMSGMGERGLNPKSKKGQAVNRAKKYGAKIVRVQKSIKSHALGKPAPKTTRSSITNKPKPGLTKGMSDRIKSVVAKKKK